MLTFPQINVERGIQSEIDSFGFPAVLRYLEKRGIPRSMLDDLGIKIFPAADLIARARNVTSAIDDRLAVIFPHFNASGDYIDWWSARLVDTGLRPVVSSFANLVPHKRGKMFCPPNEMPHAYLPPTLDWAKLEEGARVYIHESAIKAINGARLGRWSVGLNGVWGWSSRKHAVALMPELRDLPWKSRRLQPVIVFDSNAEDNWDIQSATGRLASKLLELTGQHASHLLLPRAPDGTHWGFDDFCVRHGDKIALEWLDSEATPVAIDELELLKIQLNDEVCIVRSLGRIAEQSSGTLMTRAVFTDVNYAHYTAFVEDHAVNVPRLWLSDSRRVEVDTLTYMPGSERISNGALNLWRGMVLEPSEGDVSRWMALLERNVTDLGLRKWFIQWMAYPLQNLGAKMNTFVHLFGPPGCGKQAILHPLMRAYGSNAVTIGKDQIASTFTSIYANKQFINLDEIHGGTDSVALSIINKIKRLVTDPMFTVNAKGQPEYQVPNCSNIVSTANYSDALRLDDDDRRCAVIRFGTRGGQWSREEWEAYFHWINTEGASEVYGFLLRVDTTGFDPMGWAPMTEDKVEVTRATRRVDEQWVNILWEDPDQVLPPILKGRCLMTGSELAQYCYGDDPMGVTPAKKNTLGIRMHSAGFPKITLKIDGRPERYWVIRRRDEEWTTDGARKHLATFKKKI